MSRHPQLDLLSPEQIWQKSLLAKVRNLIPWQVYDNLEKCGQDEVYQVCRGCGNWETRYYRCSLKFCPLCNYRIARRRSEMLNLWSLKIPQPKHVVLTQRNFPVLTKKKIRESRMAFGRLRRQKFWREVTGGCVSMEITNEGQGWHLHHHILADVRWLDAGQLAIFWGRLVGQEYGIVKVKDARGKTYLGEVTKYVCKPSQLVSWSPEQINEFIRAVTGSRFFTSFGTLFHLQREIKQEIRASRKPMEPCKCGCNDWTFEDERASLMGQLRRGK